MKLKKIMTLFASPVIAISASSVNLVAFAEQDATKQVTPESSKEYVQRIADYIKENAVYSDYGYTVDEPSVIPEKPEQTRFDLRDVDGKCYVPPVRDQGQFGNCWAFSVMTASETSMMFEAGYDLNTMSEKDLGNIDFSERHLAWFTYTPLPEGTAYPTQAGEGITRYRYLIESQKEDPDPAILYDSMFSGGLFALATTLFSSLQGPCYEDYAPYLSEYYINGSIAFFNLTDDQDPHNSDEAISLEGLEKEKYTFTTWKELTDLIKEHNSISEISLWETDDDWYKGPGSYYLRYIDYSTVNTMDWSVPENLRFMGFELDNSSILPYVCTVNENGEYEFDENGLNAIKNELLNGRAVTFGLWMDQSFPTKEPEKGQFMVYRDENGELTDDYYKAKYWCQYTYDPGYDPNEADSKNGVIGADHGVTIVGYDDNFPKEYFFDPNGTIGGDGAFIVRNSWGSKDTDYNYWGNDGDGYFYLSYYDQSIMCLESFDFSFDLTENADTTKLSSVYPDMYDLLPAYSHYECSGEDMKMANVFEADYDTRFYCIGFTNVTCNENVQYDIYKLNEDYKDPDDGELVASLNAFYPYAGYHRVHLEKPLYFDKGTHYSVVATVTREDGLNEIVAKTGDSKAKADKDIEMIRQQYIEENGSDEGFEIPIGIDYATAVVNKGESYVFSGESWADWADIISAMDDEDNVYDNFSIQAFTESELYNVVHEEVSPREEPYHAGDIVPCRIKVTNYTSNAEDDVDVYVNGKLIKELGPLAFDETRIVEYDYTVTEEDEKNGSIKNLVTIKMNYLGEMYVEAELYDEFSKPELVMAAESKANMVMDLIDAIGEVKYTDECRKAIIDAKKAYTALTDEQKANVSNYADLEKADEKFDALKTADDESKAKVVIDLINAIGEVEYTDASNSSITEARAAYRELTNSQQVIVCNENYSDLLTAETTYRKLSIIPQTGMSCVHNIFAGLAVLMGIAGAGLVRKSRKEDEK